jgi:3-hydroxyisobutyrate dehydrogenase
MSADSIKRVCFVGIGNMGWPMAARLVRAGFEVAVTDAVAGRAKAFVDEVGGKVVSLAEATKQADVVVTMLPTSAHVVSVVDEILPSLSSGKILVDMSSGAPAATQKIAGDLGGIGVSMSMRPSAAGYRVPSPASLRS